MRFALMCSGEGPGIASGDALEAFNYYSLQPIKKLAISLKKPLKSKPFYTYQQYITRII